MQTAETVGAYHNAADVNLISSAGASPLAGSPAADIPFEEVFTYEFRNFYHPFVGDLIKQLNQSSVAGMLSPGFLGGLGGQPYPASDYSSISPLVTIDDPDIDVTFGGPYANYNWELLYHIPVMIAVHLSNNQRFAEAQNWFHLVFNPTSTDTSEAPPGRFWTSYVFSGEAPIQDLATLINLLSSTDQADAQARAQVVAGYNAIVARPFDPHVVARSRPSAYQWYVVMKYLDNLIAWGDSLFLADTQETINEATLCYVLAANLLGPRPQQLPQPGGAGPMNFLQLRQAGLDRMSDALVDLEAQFPFNLVPGPGSGGSGPGPGTGGSGSGAGQPADTSGALFGIGRSLYFCVPANQNLLGYWDIVADRLFKIRNSENIEGVAQQLPLFDPPLDPGMLVQAAAAGIDIGSIVSGLSQPASPVRSQFMIGKALELASEVRAFGAELNDALEKGDNERLAVLRQTHEVQLQQMMQHVRFLQWKHVQENTNVLLQTRAVIHQRYAFYLSQLGLAPNPATAPANFTLDRGKLTEAGFTAAYNRLVSEYDLPISLLTYNPVKLAHAASPSSKSGATGRGQMYLNANEDAELNTHLPKARDMRIGAHISNTIAATLTPIPSAELHLAFWGLGGHSKLTSGTVLAAVAKLAATVLEILAGYHSDQANIASRTAAYQRRANDWTLQANLAALELIQIGRQVIASLIAEQVAEHEYETTKTQVRHAKAVHEFLSTKFTNADFYAWKASDLSALYYQYYRMACDFARQAEQTMKTELMRPELDQTQFIQFNYWDAGHQGLLSGEALHLDIKRMELAYHASNTRELELTRHVSLRQLDPVALLALRITGACTVTIPEWLYDRDCPGHYLRRIKTLSVSVPSVVGPYTPVNCTVTIPSSTVRTSPLLANGVYARITSQDDDRFTDYFGSTDVIVTSGGTADSGMFETNLRDERFLPFEGHGAVCAVSLELPTELRAFDYATIADVIVHVRYTARPAGDPLASAATKYVQSLFNTAGQSGQALLFCLRYDFPTEWSAFVNGTGDFQVTLSKQYFPYPVQAASRLTVDAVTLYTGSGDTVLSAVPQAVNTPAALQALSQDLTTSGQAALDLPVDSSDDTVLLRQQEQQVFLVLQYHFDTM